MQRLEGLRFAHKDNSMSILYFENYLKFHTDVKRKFVFAFLLENLSLVSEFKQNSHQKSKFMASKSNFPAECLEEIFGHLHGLNLLHCTLVCPEWNNFIGSTKACMEKINLTCSSYQEETLSSLEKNLKNSKRKYSGLNFSGPSFEKAFPLLQGNRKSWTRVVASETFISSNDALVFVRFFESSVQKLNLNCARIKNNSDLSTEVIDLQFP